MKKPTEAQVETVARQLYSSSVLHGHTRILPHEDLQSAYKLMARSVLTDPACIEAFKGQEDECLCVGNIRGTLNTALECPHHAPSFNQEDA